MGEAFRTVYEMSKAHKVHMRLAAQMVAVSSIAKALKIRGIYP